MPRRRTRPPQLERTCAETLKLGRSVLSPGDYLYAKRTSTSRPFRAKLLRVHLTPEGDIRYIDIVNDKSRSTHSVTLDRLRLLTAKERRQLDDDQRRALADKLGADGA